MSTHARPARLSPREPTELPASLEWTELSERPAVRVREKGAIQITVLSAEERDQLEALLEDG